MSFFHVSSAQDHIVLCLTDPTKGTSKMNDTVPTTTAPAAPATDSLLPADTGAVASLAVKARSSRPSSLGSSWMSPCCW